MATTTQEPLILYHYPFSPYARRLIWYLKIRNIPYYQCLQPPILPRPDLSSHLSLNYRRIPLLAHGGDLYLDTRLILNLLDTLYPPSVPLTAEQKAIEQLLSVLTTSTNLFFKAAELLPASLPAMKDPKFLKDRSSFFPGGGVKKTREERELSRAEALVEVQNSVRLLEESILSDGRDWVLGGREPTRADVEGVWVVHWLLTLPKPHDEHAVDRGVINKERYPRTMGWVNRFDEFVNGLEGREGRVVKGEEAAGMVLGGKKGGDNIGVDERDPVVKVQGLKKGDVVEVYPTDSGSGFRDRGRLVGVGEREVVWENEKGVRVHAPRVGFRVVGVKGRASL
ncbi:hypothetical protein QBC40DRAFT_173387 [Triangularia verruculosa]|uniref:GST N-terminal domain-containing protein n=1 Tax=Triangularia verruculosa TaxID=2587418 RepID=A0AAN7ATL0_9PEZI|nr:hypothetical protein QBC40DRAFT_173387 [Triangularia verruculosa]